MNAGLIYEIETVKPFKSPTYEADVYREPREQIELADHQDSIPGGPSSIQFR